MLILPDHPTPIRIRTHTGNPVPYIVYDSRHESRKLARYTEVDAAATGSLIETGHTLMAKFLEE